MNEQELASRIARLLDHGANEMQPAVSSRLGEARRRALAAYSERVERGGTGRFALPRWLDARHAVAAAAIVAVIAGGVLIGGSETDPGSEYADLDAKILSDELPLDAYLDHGFDAWLSQSQS